MGRLGIAVGTLLLLLVLFAIVEHIRGRLALNHRLKELQAKSEELSLAAVEPKHPAAGQNASRPRRPHKSAVERGG